MLNSTRHAVAALLFAIGGTLAIGRVCHWLGLRHSLAHAIAELVALATVGVVASVVLVRFR